MRLILLFFIISASSGLAQNRSIYFRLRGTQTDTLKKQLIFRYRLGNIAPKDSLGIAIRRGSGQLIKLKEVYGDVGIALTDGRKTIFWNPVAERQKFDEPIEVVFFVNKADHQGITRKQAIDAGRWAISGCLLVYTIWEASAINGAVNAYRNDTILTTPQATPQHKIDLNNTMNDLQHRKQQFYKIGAISLAALLANIALSLMQAKTKLKPARFTITNSAHGMGVAYKL